MYSPHLNVGDILCCCRAHKKMSKKYTIRLDKTVERLLHRKGCWCIRAYNIDNRANRLDKIQQQKHRLNIVKLMKIIH